MKAVDLRLKSEDELKTELLSLKKEQFNLRFQLASGQLENTARSRQVRRTIARIKTLLSEKEKGIVVEPKAKPAKKAAPKKAAAKKAEDKKEAAPKKAAAKKAPAKKAAPKKTAAKKKSDEGDK